MTDGECAEGKLTIPVVRLPKSSSYQPEELLYSLQLLHKLECLLLHWSKMTENDVLRDVCLLLFAFNSKGCGVD